MPLCETQRTRSMGRILKWWCLDRQRLLCDKLAETRRSSVYKRSIHNSQTSYSHHSSQAQFEEKVIEKAESVFRHHEWDFNLSRGNLFTAADLPPTYRDCHEEEGEQLSSFNDVWYASSRTRVSHVDRQRCSSKPPFGSNVATSSTAPALFDRLDAQNKALCRSNNTDTEFLVVSNNAF